MKAPCLDHWFAVLRGVRCLKGHHGQGSPISWRSKKQNTLSRSSAEAEYQAMANACNEIHWLRGLLTAVSIPCVAAPKLYWNAFSVITSSQIMFPRDRKQHIFLLKLFLVHNFILYYSSWACLMSML